MTEDGHSHLSLAPQVLSAWRCIRIGRPHFHLTAGKCYFWKYLARNTSSCLFQRSGLWWDWMQLYHWSLSRRYQCTLPPSTSLCSHSAISHALKSQGIFRHWTVFLECESDLLFDSRLPRFWLQRYLTRILLGCWSMLDLSVWLCIDRERQCSTLNPAGCCCYRSLSGSQWDLSRGRNGVQVDWKLEYRWVRCHSGCLSVPIFLISRYSCVVIWHALHPAGT